MLATENEVSSLQSQESTLQRDNATLTGEISPLQTKLSKVTYDPSGLNGLPTLKISGATCRSSATRARPTRP